MSASLHREGELYKVYIIDDHTIEVRYGYYEDRERGRLDPLPIFPDLSIEKRCTKDGYPIVTMSQVPCNHYKPRVPRKPEHWCGDCQHYCGGREEIGTCCCDHQRRQIMRQNE